MPVQSGRVRRSILNTHQCAVILFFALSIVLRAGNVPEGDQFASSLTQELDTVISSYMLCVKGMEESRIPEEVSHTLEVFADQYARLCSQIAQFCLWCKWYKLHPDGSRFSEGGLIQLGRFVERTQEFSNAFQDTQRLEALMAPYQSDLKVVAAERRVVAAYKTMQHIIQQAGVQPSK